MLPRVAIPALLAALALVACAAEPVAGPGPLRVMVRLAQPLPDAPSIAQAATSSAGCPVRYLSASGTDWHALVIECPDAADGPAAFERLRADRSRFSAAQIDARKRIVSPTY
ncbi:MAG: hypothetical protein KIT35_16470 [Piscinibacter sp.]|uniref:hypothetical protein n=1 Tax=Piscinibacter TaxID=1114981 RepID=UPI000FDE1E53|nr:MULTISPECIES: hypothetical protein [Piscinibacter]MCW5665429.1 hypothetical protein [Piscinibacter sp.]